MRLPHVLQRADFFAFLTFGFFATPLAAAFLLIFFRCGLEPKAFSSLGLKRRSLTTYPSGATDLHHQAR